MREIHAEKIKCTSCGLCWNEHPAFFGCDRNMLVEIKQKHIPNGFKEKLLNIAGICPGEAIHFL